MASFCHKTLQKYSAAIQHEETFMIAICVLNFLFSIASTLGNLIVIHALWKASSIPANLKKLFLSLAFSDLAIGLIIQPTSAVTLAVMLNIAADGNYDFDRFCPSVITVATVCTSFVVGASFSTITAIAMDRYLALFIHLRYQELVTEKRVNIALLISWVNSAVVACAFTALPSNNDMVAVAFVSVGLLILTVVYFRIYKVARYHRNQIQCQNQFQNDEVREVARVRKSALNAFYVYIISLLCYVPNLLASILLEFYNLAVPILAIYFLSGVLLFLNSSLNPLVYCWRYREVRNIVKNTVLKMVTYNNAE